jgi:hypothetical protein
MRYSHYQLPHFGDRTAHRPEHYKGATIGELGMNLQLTISYIRAA